MASATAATNSTTSNGTAEPANESLPNDTQVFVDFEGHRWQRVDVAEPTFPPNSSHFHRTGTAMECPTEDHSPRELIETDSQGSDPELWRVTPVLTLDESSDSDSLTDSDDEEFEYHQALNELIRAARQLEPPTGYSFQEFNSNYLLHELDRFLKMQTDRDPSSVYLRNLYTAFVRVNPFFDIEKPMGMVFHSFCQLIQSKTKWQAYPHIDVINQHLLPGAREKEKLTIKEFWV